MEVGDRELGVQCAGLVAHCGDRVARYLVHALLGDAWCEHEKRGRGEGEHEHSADDRSFYPTALFRGFHSVRR